MSLCSNYTSRLSRNCHVLHMLNFIAIIEINLRAYCFFTVTKENGFFFSIYIQQQYSDLSTLEV